MRNDLPLERYKGKPYGSLKDIERFDEKCDQLKLENLKTMKKNLEEKLKSVERAMQLLESHSKERVKVKLRKQLNKSLICETPDDFRRKCTAASEFIRKISVKKLQLEQNKLKRQQIALKKESLHKEIEKEKEIKQELIKAESIKNIANSYEKLRNERRVQQILWSQLKNNVIPKGSSYLYNKYERKYKKEIISSTLEKRKMELMKRRKFMKAVTFNEVEAHRREYEKGIIERKKIKQKEIEARKEAERILAQETKKFQTGISIRVKLMDEQRKQEIQQELLHKEILRQKKVRYSEILNDLYVTNETSEKGSDFIIGGITPIKQRNIAYSNYLSYEKNYLIPNKKYSINPE